MNIITGNLLDIPEGVLIHQVNCQKVAGAGLALAIRNKWPGWYTHYKKTRFPEMGEVTFYRVNRKLQIANLFAQVGYYGQYGYGFEKGRRQTNYDGFRECLQTLADVRFGQYYLPYKIGCGLAGGDWAIISQMIEEILPEATIVRLSNG